MQSMKRSKSSHPSSPSSSSSSSRSRRSSSSSSSDSSSSTDSDSDSSSSDDEVIAPNRPPAASRHPLPPLIHKDPSIFIDSNPQTHGMNMSAISREPLQLFMTGSGQGYVKGKGGMYMSTSADSEDRKRYKYKYSSEKIQRKMDAAKKKHRPSLKMHDWQRYNYASIFNGYRHDSYLSMPPTPHPQLYSHLRAAKQQAVKQQAAASAPCTCDVAKSTTHHPPINFHLPTSLAQQHTLASPTSNHSATPTSPSHHHSSCPQRIARQTTPPSSHYSCPTASLPSYTACGIDRVHWRDLSCERFIRDYEAPQRPVMILGLADAWNSRNWDPASLQRSKFKNCTFKCGEDDDGYSIKVKLKHFLQYMHQQKDDSPMYIFDCSFDENSVAKDILNDFEVPMYFRDDLFSLVGAKRRPPHRWFLVGPERSGSSLHIDPLATSAWNTLLTGAKRWVLFQPGTARKYCKNDFFKQKGEDNEAITYFMRSLPRIREQEERKQGGSDIGICEFIQYPGETVFVPGGWWHAVLNLEDSFAVTQNFVSRTNFEDVWRQTRKGRKHMARRWLQALETAHPDLAARARKCDQEDNFVFQFSDPRARSSKSEKKKNPILIKKKHKSSSMGMSSRDRDESDRDRCSDTHKSKHQTNGHTHTNGYTHTNGNGHMSD